MKNIKDIDNETKNEKKMNYQKVFEKDCIELMSSVISKDLCDFKGLVFLLIAKVVFSCKIFSMIRDKRSKYLYGT